MDGLMSQMRDASLFRAKREAPKEGAAAAPAAAAMAAAKPALQLKGRLNLSDFATALKKPSM